MPDDIKVGYHDKGFWDSAKTVSSNKNPIAGNLNINDAISRAKANSGAELIIVDDSGNAKVHSLTINDSLSSKKRVIDNKELFRNPFAKQDKTKMPLVINDNLAQVFSGRNAFLVDEKDNVTYLGDDVEKTTAESTLKDAEKLVATPNKNKVDTAYAMAKEAGNEKRIEVKLSQSVLDKISTNYKDIATAESAVSFLKPSDSKTKMEKFLVDIKSVDKLNTEDVNKLNSELNARTQKYTTDISAPQKRLDTANNNWNSSSNQEEQKVKLSSRNLREAKMPNIHLTEDNLSAAQYNRDEMRAILQGSTSKREDAQNSLNSIENLLDEIQSLKGNINELKRDNRNQNLGLMSYLSFTESNVSSDIRSKERDLRSYQSDLSIERSKPSRPSNSGNGNSLTSDPFSKGGGNSVTSDPFSNRNDSYRDDSKISRLENEIRSLGSEIRELESRRSSLSSLSYRVSIDTDLSSISPFFYGLSFNDRMAVQRFSDKYSDNKREIKDNSRLIVEKEYKYSNNIDGARNNLSNAKSEESNAKNNLSNSEEKVNSLSSELSSIKSNPRDDNDPKVKPFVIANNKALDTQEKTVGENAPLTKEKKTSKGIVDSINYEYQKDKGVINTNIANSENIANAKAQQLIKETRTKL